MTDSNSNKREFTRVPIEVRVQVVAEDGVTTEGIARDLSMKGLRLKTSRLLLVDTRCQVKLLLEGGGPVIEVNVRGVVVRVDPDGAALDFTAVEADSFEHLRNLVLYNTSNIGQVQKELEGRAGLPEKEGKS